jgi:uncharacterized ion transporter superfamily protein YfcC
MKKYNLLKIVLITIFVATLLTWLIPGSAFDGTIKAQDRSMLGIWTLVTYPIVAFSYFAYVGLFIVVVGGFYGLLNKTGVYKSILDSIVKKFKNDKKLFLIISILSMALLSSFTNLSIGLLVFVPFLISIILLMGYDRVVALLSTIGAIFVGFIGSTYNNSIALNINSILKLDIKDELISKIPLLIIATVLLVFYVLEITKKKAKTNKEEKSFDDPLYLAEKNSKNKVLPLIVTLIITAVIVIFSSIAWKEAFGLDWFEKANDAIFKFKLGEFLVFNKLLGTIPAFGNWMITEIMVLLVFVSIILALVYKIKLDDAIEAFIKGCKTMLQTALIVVLSYIVLIIIFYNQSTIYVTVADFILGLTKGFNIVTMIIATFIGSLMSSDVTNFTPMATTISSTIIKDSTSYNVMSVLIQSIYGLAMFVAPTSVLLLFGLNYLKVPYFKWLKHIAKLLLQLFIVILVVSIIIMVI